MKNDLECKDCPYCWYDYDEKTGEAISSFPRCHWVPRCPDDFAPCEESWPDEDYDQYVEYNEEY